MKIIYAALIAGIFISPVYAQGYNDQATARAINNLTDAIDSATLTTNLTNIALSGDGISLPSLHLFSKPTKIEVFDDGNIKYGGALYIPYNMTQKKVDKLQAELAEANRQIGLLQLTVQQQRDELAPFQKQVETELSNLAKTQSVQEEKHEPDPSIKNILDDINRTTKAKSAKSAKKQYPTMHPKLTAPMNRVKTYGRNSKVPPTKSRLPASTTPAKLDPLYDWHIQP